MMLKQGTSNITAAYFGTLGLTAIRLGSVLIWQRTEREPFLRVRPETLWLDCSVGLADTQVISNTSWQVVTEADLPVSSVISVTPSIAELPQSGTTALSVSCTGHWQVRSAGEPQ